MPDEWQIGQDVDGVEYIWHASAGYKSKRSLCLKKTADRYFPTAQWFQTVACPVGSKRLKVSAYIKARQLRKGTLDVQFLGSNGNMLGHHWMAYVGEKGPGAPPANHDWKLYEGTADIPANTTQIVIAPQIYGQGTVWFDNISATID